MAADTGSSSATPSRHRGLPVQPAELVGWKRPYVHPSRVVADIPAHTLEGTRVLLINMPIREAAPPNNAPLGPALLAATLRARGCEVSLLDLNAYRLKDEEARRRDRPTGRHLNPREAGALLERHLAHHGEPHLVGLSGKITTLRWQEEISRRVRQLLPRTLLVSGNGLATQFRDGLFVWIPELNGVAHSEGDEVVLKAAHDARVIADLGPRGAIESGRLAPYLVGERDGQPLFVYDGGRPQDLDALPLPAYDLLEADVDGRRVLDTYLGNPIWGLAANNSSATPFTMQRSINTVSSRGCPFACRFCYRGSQGERNYGVRSAHSLAREIEHYADTYGVDFVGISDDNFMVQRERIAELVPVMRNLVQRGIRWGTHGRLDEAADLRTASDGTTRVQSPTRVEMMAEAGCVYIGFGAESADEHVLTLMGKGGFILTNGSVDLQGYRVPRTMVEGVKNTKAAGIHANCTWIMGYPGERLEHLKNSVAFIQWQVELYTSGLTPGTVAYEAELQGVNRRMFTATAYPGTELFNDPVVRERLGEEFGLAFDADGRPRCDAAMHSYVSQLEDASKIIEGPSGRPIYYGDMPLDTFLEARHYADSGQLSRILDMR